MSLSQGYEPVGHGRGARGGGGQPCEHDVLRKQPGSYQFLDAAQLVKHAFALRTTVHKEGPRLHKKPVLLYLHADPKAWPDGETISAAVREAHRQEIDRFAQAVKGDEVTSPSGWTRGSVIGG